MICYSSTLENVWDNLEEPEIDQEDFVEVFSKMPAKKKAAPDRGNSPLAKKSKEVIHFYKNKIHVTVQFSINKFDYVSGGKIT